MKKRILIVGSGIGGGTLAKELSKNKDLDITLLERGQEDKWGWAKTLVDFATGQYPLNLSEEGTMIWRTFGYGGTGNVTYANAVPCYGEEFKKMGIDLTQEFEAAKTDLEITEVSEEYMGERTKKILQAAKELGYNFQPMPKAIKFLKCKNCGMCIHCTFGAKWTTKEYLKEAKENGVKILTGMLVEKVEFSDGVAQRVRGIGSEGVFEIDADIIVLAAGGLATPVILQKSGITEAGTHLFADLYVDTYGTMKGISMKPELPMALVLPDFHESDGFLLAPYAIRSASGDMLTLRPPTFYQMDIVRLDQTFGIMTKIKDEGSGKVNIDGSIEKECTKSDWGKLKKGIALSKKILMKIGCDEESIYSDRPQGAHPGGTAGIGRVVDINLETKMKNLYVCDASVFPEAPGTPPVVTIIALAKRLAKSLY